MKKIIVAIIAILIILSNKSCFSSLDPFGGGSELTPGAGSFNNDDSISGSGNNNPETVKGSGSEPADSLAQPHLSDGISDGIVDSDSEETGPSSVGSGPPEVVVDTNTGDSGLTAGLDTGGEALAQTNVAPVENGSPPDGTEVGTVTPGAPAGTSGVNTVNAAGTGDEAPGMGVTWDEAQGDWKDKNKDKYAQAEQGEALAQETEPQDKPPEDDAVPVDSQGEETQPIGTHPKDENGDDKHVYGTNNSGNDSDDVWASGHGEDIVKKEEKQIKEGETRVEAITDHTGTRYNLDPDTFGDFARSVMEDENSTDSARVGVYIAGTSNGVKLSYPDGDDDNGDNNDGDGNYGGNSSLNVYLGGGARNKKLPPQEQNKWHLLRAIFVKADSAQQVNGYNGYKEALGQDIGRIWTETRLPRKTIQEIAKYYSAQDAEFKGWFVRSLYLASLIAAQEGNTVGMENFQNFVTQLPVSQQEEVRTIISQLPPGSEEINVPEVAPEVAPGGRGPITGPAASAGVSFYGVGNR
jgi:hypothetical protein